MGILSELPVSRVYSDNAKYFNTPLLNRRRARLIVCAAVSDRRSDTGGDISGTQVIYNTEWVSNKMQI